MENVSAEKLVQVGMRAAIRDIQDYLAEHEYSSHLDPVVGRDGLSAYLLAMLITTGLYDDLSDAAA